MTLEADIDFTSVPDAYWSRFNDTSWRRTMARILREFAEAGPSVRRGPLTGRDLVLFLHDRVDIFNARDASFVTSLMRFRTPSEKQLKWCGDIVRRYRIET